MTARQNAQAVVHNVAETRPKGTDGGANPSSIDRRLLDILVCPTCHGSLEASRDGQHVTGLRCQCGRAYPVVDGVPRLLDTALHASGSARVAEAKRNADPSDDYENIRKSFSEEWGIFDYEADKTWGWTLPERKSVFLGDVGLRPDQLVGKRLLDAGCGNGTLTAALSDFEMEIAGLDLNDNLGAAHQNRANYGSRAADHVRYVQGNLVSPPFREESFDLVYSSGVIHHTPSSETTFASIARLTKPGGRLYVWVYGKRPLPVRVFFAVGRSLKSIVSLRTVMTVCRLMAPVYRIAATALDALGMMRFRKRTSHEITLDLFDAFAPRYNHWHTEAEVRSWFESRGFRNVTASGHQKHGFGMYGDRG